jgi:hypothetical protein
MLKPLMRKKLAVWDDTKIKAGAKWKDEIQGALAAAKVAVLLVSPNFLESDFIADHELPPLLDAATKEGLVIHWIYISHCLYEETEIKDYQAANDISRPLESLTRPEQNAVLVNVCRDIKAASNPLTYHVNNPEEAFTSSVRNTASEVMRRVQSEGRGRPSVEERYQLLFAVAQLQETYKLEQTMYLGFAAVAFLVMLGSGIWTIATKQDAIIISIALSWPGGVFTLMMHQIASLRDKTFETLTRR